MNDDYMLERRLLLSDKDLHERYKNCTVVTNRMLLRYQQMFPEYTDHSNLHVLAIIDYCNQLIGNQGDKLTADDIYVLLMGALFHDIGMGVTSDELICFIEGKKVPENIPVSKEENMDFIRKYHHELSGWYLEKYWSHFDIPNEAYARAIIQVCRGHRKVDLFAREEYPEKLEVSENRFVQLAYLSALIRLSDELDIAAERNLSFLYNSDTIQNNISRMEFLKHECIQRVDIMSERIVVRAKADNANIYAGILEMVNKLGETLEYCRKVAVERSSFQIMQTRIDLEMMTE